MEKTWGKNGGTKNVTIDCSSSTFTAQTDTLFKTLHGHHPKSAAHTHLGQISQGYVEITAEGLGSRDNNFFNLMVDKKINFTLFILVVNQIHNSHKQFKLYIFQDPSDSL